MSGLIEALVECSMSIFKTGAAVCAALLLAACATGQTGQTAGSSPSASSAGSAANVGDGPAASMNIRVGRTIVEVGDVPNEVLLRENLAELKSGLHWSRGVRPTNAVIRIGGERDVVAGGGDAAERREEPLQDGFGQSVLYGTVSLVDVQTGDVVVAPITIQVEVGSNRDMLVGITEGTKKAVELEYLAQKFILAGREALYGKGV